MRWRNFRDDPPDESEREHDEQIEVEQVERDLDEERPETGDTHHFRRTARDIQEMLDDLQGGES